MNDIKLQVHNGTEYVDVACIKPEDIDAPKLIDFVETAPPPTVLTIRISKEEYEKTKAALRPILHPILMKLYEEAENDYIMNGYGARPWLRGISKNNFMVVRLFRLWRPKKT